MIKFTHIESLATVAKYVASTRSVYGVQNDKVIEEVTFRGTVKLHGTNAGVVCTSKELIAQSRNRVLTVDNDNAGFAKFVAGEKQTAAIRVIEAQVREDHNVAPQAKVVFYGEWIGPGIQKNMAINLLPEKQWVIFAVAISNVDDSRIEYINAIMSLRIEREATGIHTIMDVGIWSLPIDFSSPTDLQDAFDYATGRTLAVQERCPWGATHGYEGLGEGIVWIPLGEHWGNSDLYWKTKGPKHQTVNKEARTVLSADPDLAQKVDAFVACTVTGNRLRQGLEYLQEMGYPLTMKSTSHYLKWIGGDVKRECAVDLEERGLTWKQTSKAVAQKAIVFFKEEAERL